MVDNSGKVTPNASQSIALSPATSVVVQNIFERGKKRNDDRFQYVNDFSGAVEALLIFAVERLTGQWKSGDQSKEGRMLRQALEEGKPLTPHQQQLVELAFARIHQPAPAKA